MKQNKLKGWIFVIVQFTFTPFVAILAYFEHKSTFRQPSDIFLYISICIYIAAAVIGFMALISFNQKVTPMPIPRTGSRLVTNGIYAVIRHPMYLSVILFIFGFILYVQAYFCLIPFVLLVYFFTRKINFEEKQLFEKFAEYKSYQLKTKKLFPFIY